MPLKNHKYAPQNYLLSGIPYLSSSTVALGETLQFSFNKISQRIAVRNNGGTAGNTIAVSFTENGLSNSQFTILDDGESFEGNFRVQEIFVSGSAGGSATVEVAAELTEIDQKGMPFLSASNTNYKGYSEDFTG